MDRIALIKAGRAYIFHRCGFPANQCTLFVLRKALNRTHFPWTQHEFRRDARHATKDELADIVHAYIGEPESRAAMVAALLKTIEEAVESHSGWYGTRQPVVFWTRKEKVSA